MSISKNLRNSVIGLGLSASLLMACQKPKEENKAIEEPAIRPALTFPASPQDIFFYPAMTAIPKARIFLAHGFGGDRMVYENYPFSGWRLDLQLAGYEVVTYNLPPWKFEYFSRDGGLEYRLSYIQFLKWLLREFETEKGPLPQIAGGISFGGLHAMMAVELLPGEFSAWFGGVPVVDYTALSELAGGSSEHFHPAERLDLLAATPGFLHYGEQDERVNYRLTIELIQQISQRPNFLSWQSLGPVGHASTPENLQIILDWLESLWWP